MAMAALEYFATVFLDHIGELNERQNFLLLTIFSQFLDFFQHGQVRVRKSQNGFADQFCARVHDFVSDSFNLFLVAGKTGVSRDPPIEKYQFVNLCENAHCYEQLFDQITNAVLVLV